MSQPSHRLLICASSSEKGTVAKRANPSSHSHASNGLKDSTPTYSLRSNLKPWEQARGREGGCEVV